MDDTTERIELGADLAGEDYAAFLDAIRRNLDPSSNTVLLVDDERAIRMKVARDVRKCAPEVVVFEAGNGREALAKLVEIRRTHNRDPLVIVLDLQMPVMDGWEFIRQLKQEYESRGAAAGIPILVLSSSSGEKGALPMLKKSVHGGKTGYKPLVTVAKENCVEGSRYDAAGAKGLLSWLEYFLR